MIIKQSTIEGAGSGAFANRNIKKGEFLANYKGKWMTHEQYSNKKRCINYIWEVKDCDGEIVGFLDGGNKKFANWTRYVNCPNTKKQENVLSVDQLSSEREETQHLEQEYTINYYASRNIKKGEELFVWYGASYGELLTGSKELL